MTNPARTIQFDADTPTADIVDEIKDAVLALDAPLRVRNNKLFWRVGEQLIPMTTQRLVDKLSSVGIRFERCVRGKWEPVNAPNRALRLFLELAEAGTWEWEEGE